MNITPQAYGKMSEAAAPRSNVKVNVTAAFFVGGGICALGQVIRLFFDTFGFNQ